MQKSHPQGLNLVDGRATVAVEEGDVGGRQRAWLHNPGVADLAGGQAHERRVAVLPPRRR